MKTGCRKICLMTVAAVCVITFVMPSYGFDFLQKAKDAIGTVDVSRTGLLSAAGGTFRNTDRKFSFTLPAGWEKLDGDPDSDRVSYKRIGTTQSFNFHYTAMSKSFPSESSVQASLKTAKEEVRQGKNERAKRRDDFCGQKDKKVVCARGWELVDSGKGGIQRIIWQCYDRDNHYFNFMTASDTKEFALARDTLQTIIDSIQFEK